MLTGGRSGGGRRAERARTKRMAMLPKWARAGRAIAARIREAVIIAADDANDL